LNNFDGFIFDVDGTITSTNKLIFATFNHVTEKYLQKTYTDSEIISLFGPTEEEIMLDLFKDDYQKAREDYYEFYSGKHSKMAFIFPGIKEILEMIKSKNIPLGIYTGKGSVSTEITLKDIGVYDLFDLIVTGSDVAIHKPDPEGINMFVEKFNLDKDRVLMIGDAPADLIASRGAGVKSGAVLWDSYAYDRVIEMGSNFTFNTVEELKTFVHENI